MPPVAHIFHPVLGIGGAERLLLDFARALREAGVQPQFWVHRYDASHAFSDAVDFEVNVVDSWFPENPLGVGRFVSAYQRMKSVLREARKRSDPALSVVDLTPHIIPEVKRLWPQTPVLGYCHFPDRYLARNGGRVYDLYRAWVDRLEREGWQAADRVLANSSFTRQTLLDAVPGLDEASVGVLYPPVPKRLLDGETERAAARSAVLVLSRFDPRKNQALAVRSFASLVERGDTDGNLLLAGGCDPRDSAARAALKALERLISDLGIENRVELHVNPDSAALERLWARAAVLLHPARFEHFGIVPLEAMDRGVPVVALNEGGPAEVVVDGSTGYLTGTEPAEVALRVARILGDRDLAAGLGRAGRARARGGFGFDRFRSEVAREIRTLI